MNPEDYSRSDLLGDISLLWLGVVFAAAAVLWWGTWVVRERWRSALWPLSIVGGILVSVGFWAVFQVLGHWFALATSWPLIGIALLGGFCWEAILAIYRFERGLVAVGRGRLLLWLRLAALVTLILVLLQPVRSFLEDREINREIAILVDDSESMQLSDQRLSVSEILDRAQLFGAEVVVQQRAPLREVQRMVADLKNHLGQEIDAVAGGPSLAAGLEARAELLPAVFEERQAEVGLLVELLQSAELAVRDGGSREQIAKYRSDVEGQVRPALDAAVAAVGAGEAERYQAELSRTTDLLDRILSTIGGVSERSDKTLFDALSEAEREQIGALAARPRSDLIEMVAGSTNGYFPETSLVDQLGERYNLRFYHFNRSIEEAAGVSVDVAGDESLPARAETDLTGAIEHVLENSSPESLAGILLFSDGRHNAAGLPEDSLRQLAIQNSPLCAVPIGGREGPIDSSILSLNAPESIYLDDRVVIRSVAKMDGLLGKKVRAQLLTDGQVVDEQEIEVTDVNFRSEIRFVHTPEAKGIIDYQVKLEPDEREIFQNNNTWDFKVAVTDDRTNVLLVDGYPRWEFRYLRNLFYGRDKSVHLQYVLLNPDTVSGMRAPPAVPADATRKFGDAEATELPKTAEDWQLFDVIILGDMAPNQLTSLDWRAIDEAVTKRGALLVCVAGPRHMPHAFKSGVLRDLLPVTYEVGDGDLFASPEQAYQVELTAAGRGHPVTSQSVSRSLNAELWAQFPPLRWRWQSATVKEGAEVLAYAQSVSASDRGGTDESDVGVSPDSVEQAIMKLTQQKEREQENALITTMRSGLGKVVMMNFDRTWRFRYGVGDTYHHRFWGQLTRWGAGPNLRSGNEMVRVGTDRLSYTPSDEISVTAKVLDVTRKPLMDEVVYANVYRGEQRIARQRLEYRSDSSGLYQTTFAGFKEEGEYRVELEGDHIDRALSEDTSSGMTQIATELLVLTNRNPIELAELTADRDFLNRAANMTNGQVAEVWQLDSLLNAFGAPKEILKERRNITLWDKWPLLVAFLVLVTLEWIMRRRGGLV